MPIEQLSGYRKGGSVLEKNEQLMVTDISNLIDGVNAIPVTPASLTFSGIFTQAGPSAPNYLVIQSGITPAGTNYGVEIDFRVLLSSIIGTKENKFLDDLTIFSNLAVIRSKVDISNLIETSVDTPLQGQSPYVFNAGLQYLNKELTNI